MAKKLSTKKNVGSKQKREGSSSTPESFEESLAELESIVHQLETGKLPLGESLARYEEGVGHLKSCHNQLSSAERRIELLSGVDAEGNPITQSLGDEGGEDLQEKAQNRSRRRTSGPVKRSRSKPAVAETEAENDVDGEELLF